MKNFSTTYISTIVAFIVFALPLFGLQVTNEDTIEEIVSQIVGVGALLYTFYGRYKAKGITAWGIKNHNMNKKQKIKHIKKGKKQFYLFLKTEQGRKWLAVYLPRAKEFLKKYIGYAPFTLLEKIYPTYIEEKYEGLIQDYDEEKELRGISPKKITGLPEFIDMYDKNKHLIFQSMEQGRTGTCVTFSFNNLIRLSKRRRGLKDKEIEMDISLVYRDTKVGKGNRGTVIQTCLNTLSKKDVPVQSWKVIKHHTEITAIENSKDIEKGWDYVYSFFEKKNMIQAKNFAHFLKLDKSLGEEYECQVSVDFSKALKWYRERKPYIDAKKSLKRTGGHSLILVRGTQAKDTDGENIAGILIDSAYRKHQTGERLLSAVLVDIGIARIRFVKIKHFDKTKPTSTLKLTKDEKILSKFKITFGDRNTKVKALQRYLKVKDDGIFGEKTRVALQIWQLKQLGKLYTGKFWGSISIRRFKELLVLGGSKNYYK